MCRRVYEEDDDVCCSGYCSETVHVRRAGIDGGQSWGYLGGILQREAPGSGRYRVSANFHNRATKECVTVEYWLPCDSFSPLPRERQDESRNDFKSYCEIINSGRHPSEFAGATLPSNPAIYERDFTKPCSKWTSKECADRSCKGWVCDDHAVTCSECCETFHAHCVAVLPDGQTPVCRECLKNIPADIISEVVAA